jgi:hypothetical protein
MTEVICSPAPAWNETRDIDVVLDAASSSVVVVAAPKASTNKVHVNLTDQSYWSWFLGWKIRSVVSRTQLAFAAPVHFAEFDLVPDEIWLDIFAYLSADELADARRVCRLFARLCCDRSLVSRYALVKLPPKPMAQLLLTPVSVVLVGDRGIGKTRLATAFLTDVVNGPRHGFGTRLYVPADKTALLPERVPVAPAPSKAPFRWLTPTTTPPKSAGAGGETVRPFGVSIFDLANSASTKREILAFPLLSHAVAVAFVPTAAGVAGISEWIRVAHATTTKERSKQGFPAKAPIVLMCIRNNMSVAGASADAVPVEVRQLARTLSAEHGVQVQGFDVDPADGKALAKIDRAFGAAISMMQKEERER